jgi:nucleoside-diphosphate-sugar epimerase
MRSAKSRSLRPEMPRGLIAGCGYVGSASARLFVEAGWEVTAWTRSKESAEQVSGGGISAVAIDISDVRSVARNSFDADVVVHCAGVGKRDDRSYRHVYGKGVANLAASFPQARLIFTSSTSVYAQQDGSWVTEESPAEPLTERGKILRRAENIVLDHEGIVLRVAGIYGPGRSFLLRSVINRAPLPSGPDRFVNQVHRDDVASAIFFLAAQKAVSRPGIFNVVDDRPVLRSKILAWLSAELRIPLSPAEGIGRKRTDSNKRVSNAKLRALGWAPIYPNYIDAFTRSILPQHADRGNVI